ncbi:hypothetical protein F2Q70_00041897 [Brassica cretica]|uniref:Uncharacterized protein n=1 Tax=Brassica cretica TaxID=69181 RepID=A0A8S9K3C9_BRACR|nr:hypothetical protein F2Q70_00041897 [Brassica cretica]
MLWTLRKKLNSLAHDAASLVSSPDPKNKNTKSINFVLSENKVQDQICLLVIRPGLDLVVPHHEVVVVRGATLRVRPATLGVRPATFEGSNSHCRNSSFPAPVFAPAAASPPVTALPPTVAPPPTLPIVLGVITVAQLI